MAGICFFFENNDVDVWSGRNSDLDAWNYACKVAGDIDKAIIINQSSMDLKTFDENMDVKIVSSLKEANIEGHITQLVCPWNTAETTSLWDYDHNTDWYIFGPAEGWEQDFFGTQVCVPQHSKGGLHSVHVATTVMLHRYSVKNGS
jgi:hypothetical protein